MCGSPVPSPSPPSRRASPSFTRVTGIPSTAPGIRSTQSSIPPPTIRKARASARLSSCLREGSKVEGSARGGTRTWTRTSSPPTQAARAPNGKMDTRPRGGQGPRVPAHERHRPRPAVPPTLRKTHTMRGGRERGSWARGPVRRHAGRPARPTAAAGNITHRGGIAPRVSSAGPRGDAATRATSAALPKRSQRAPLVTTDGTPPAAIRVWGRTPLRSPRGEVLQQIVGGEGRVADEAALEHVGSRRDPDDRSEEYPADPQGIVVG